MKKCILIDVQNETITEVSIGNGIQPIYDILGIKCFEIIGIDWKNDLFVDENGMLTLTPESKFFSFQGFSYPLVGNALVMGVDKTTGESKDTTLTVDYIKSIIKFHNYNDVKNQFA